MFDLTLLNLISSLPRIRRFEDCSRSLFTLLAHLASFVVVLNLYYTPLLDLSLLFGKDGLGGLSARSGDFTS
jgi:hypothetical protein